MQFKCRRTNQEKKILEDIEKMIHGNATLKGFVDEDVDADQPNYRHCIKS
jgi:hypothetical protein